MEEVGEKKKENLEGKKKKERPRGTQGENNVVFFYVFLHYGGSKNFPDLFL